MLVRSFVYDSTDAAPHVGAVVDLLADREEAVDVLDVATASDPDAAHREAMLLVKEAIRIGSVPDELFDGDGDPDFSPGALVSEAPTGRRTLHVGPDALAALRDEE